MANEQQQLGLLVDNLQSNEQLNKALRDAAVAIGECAATLSKCICEIVASLASSNTDALVAALSREIADEKAAYTLAAKEHSEWVHRATYCKKKRIRKKYHDRIMRQYGRG
jgi:hypothetical protein